MVDQTHEAKSPKRLYDKGDRRFKHVGKGAEPYIEFDEQQPKKWVGKCPNTHSDLQKLKLLKEAIPDPAEVEEMDYEKTLYVVDGGAIYEAQSSDWGRSYHGYPYRGKLGAKLLAELKDQALKKDCLKAFEDWVKDHIEPHGQ